MQKYLLDTCILLWWLESSNKLPAYAKALIDDTQNVLYVSAAAIWEIAMKKSLGRLNTPDNLLDILQQQNMYLLPIKAEHALQVAALPWLHRDPFDRIQIAQAQVEKLNLITSDELIRQYDTPDFSRATLT